MSSMWDKVIRSTVIGQRVGDEYVGLATGRLLDGRYVIRPYGSSDRGELVVTPQMYHDFMSAVASGKFDLL